MIEEKDIVVVDQPELGAVERLYLLPIFVGMWTSLRHLASTWFKNATFRSDVIQYPEQKAKLHTSEYRGLHRLNRDEEGRVACVACFMCATACPAKCIHIEAGEAPWPDREKYPVKFDIDELRCIFCGMCEEACPIDAIQLTDAYDFVGRTRQEMVLDKEELLSLYDKTKEDKPRNNPRITGYPKTAARSGEHESAKGVEQA